ncbi:MAG: AMP-binding protein, partial [Halobacteriales archaeon]|nr:AMP-binding protein [Halobacteriales archaeon]
MPIQAETVADLFWDSVRANGERPAQEWHEGNEWPSRTYLDLGRAVRDLAHSLLANGVKKGDRVALWSRNSPRWAEVDFADLSAGFVTVPIYDTLTPEKAAFIVGDAGAKVLFVADAATLRRLQPLRASLKALSLIVVLNDDAPAEKGVKGYHAFLAEGREWGRRHPDRLDEAVAGMDADDLASIVYTSGTTGEPKGVMLTHGNFASNATTALSLVAIGPYDVFLSFLPLSHVFERLAGHFCAYGAGAKVVFARSVDALADDMVRARPTLMMSVPRLYEKMHAKVLAKVASDSFVRRAVFRWAMRTGAEGIRLRQEGRPIPARLQKRLARAQRLVFHKLQERVGGRLRFFVSGGAALSPEIETFFWAAGITILQGYGLTETSPLTNVNLPEAFHIGSVGRTI